jgi:hypothetical protein
LPLNVKVKESHDNLTEDMMVEVVKRQHSVRNAFRSDSCTVKKRRINWKKSGANSQDEEPLNHTKRCRLSWLTISALVFDPKCGGRGRLAG